MDIFKNFVKTEFDRKKLWHNLLLFTVVLFCVITCFSVFPRVKESIEYPLSSVAGRDWWVQQFDAFEKGQLHLDLEVDPSLSELENPYDPDQRAYATYFWDRVYYDGYYYSYFGIAPILTFYYPYYFLTGSLPSASIAVMFTAVAAMIMLGFLYRELIIKFCPKANLLLTAALFVGVAFSSGIFLTLCWADSYYLAVVSAILWSVSFLFLVFRAIRAKHTATRAILFALAAFSLTMTVWSRPTVAIICALVLPLLVGYAIEGGRERLRDKLICAAAFFVPLACGAGAVMWYNAARFGSPFDFGSAYQLTVSDISKNKLEASMFFDSVYHYFLRAPAPTGEYPFFTTSLIKPEYDKYFYATKTVGAFSFGIPAATLCAPFVCRVKKDPVKFATVFLGLALALFVGFFDYCYAGINLRYLIDILPVLTLLGAVLLLNVHSEAHGQSPVRYRGLITFIIILLCLLSVLVTVGITRSNVSSLIFPIEQ